MRTFVKPLAGLLACCALAGGAATAFGDDAPTNIPEGQKVLAATTFRASKLIGLNVRNMQGEKLGTVDDMVIDVRTGKISYAALSHGGVLGLGDKLFAVPFAQLRFDHGQDEMFFVLDMPKEKLETAPGFDKSSWPNFADANWSKKIDDYYRKSQVETRTKTTTTETRTEPVPVPKR